VIPGKSTIVMFGQLFELMLRMMGLLMITFSFPQSLSVRKSIFSLTSLKLVNVAPGISSNLAMGCFKLGSYVSLSSKGLLVTTPYISENTHRSTRQEVDSDDLLEQRALTGGLRPDDDHFGQLDQLLEAEVPQVVHERDDLAEVIH
jgi:hypothetical protein